MCLGLLFHVPADQRARNTSIHIIFSCRINLLLQSRHIAGSDVPVRRHEVGAMELRDAIGKPDVQNAP